MMLMMIPAPWLKATTPNLAAIQKDCDLSEAIELNLKGFNVYHYPNYPKVWPDGYLQAEDVNVFDWVFVDLDLKHGAYMDKQEFLTTLSAWDHKPTKIIDSGNGLHAYWRVSDLDAKSFLTLSRRLCRHFNTDPAVSQLKQLMRVPGTLNVKDQEDWKPCELLSENTKVYTCEQLSAKLPPITQADADYCTRHYNSTHNVEVKNTKVNEELPFKFKKLLRSSKEVKQLYSGISDDRSGADFRLAHVLLAEGFSKQDAMSVLVNCAKAKERAQHHRIGYAESIVDKIGLFEDAGETEALSESVQEILEASGDTIKGTRFPCHVMLDDTHHGFRLGQVIGLVAGSGVGKTSMALNMFRWFVKNNPNYEHFFVPLEQPVAEIADRWKTICQGNTRLFSKVHLISNYNKDGSFRHLSLGDIRDYLLEFQAKTGKKVGSVVIDHIGALKAEGKNGENQRLIDICSEMKSFAVQTNSLVVMQSQAPREKAGIGDLELNKDAAYGTVFFESYCDYLLTLWQPVKRCYSSPDCPTVMAFKFCKIRHKKRGLDTIQEDVCYAAHYDAITERMRPLTEAEDKSFKFYVAQATNIRKKDRKTDIVNYTSLPPMEVSDEKDA